MERTKKFRKALTKALVLPAVIFAGLCGEKPPAYGQINSPSPDEVTLAYEGVIQADSGEAILLPLRINKEVELGAMTIALNYNTQLIEVTGLQGSWDVLSSIDKDNGNITIAWSNVTPQTVGQDSIIVSFSALLLNRLDSTTRYMELRPGTEFADPSASVIEGIVLKLPSIHSPETPVEQGFFVPDFISPNSDGYNDYFFVRLDGMEALEVKIFDAWGDLIYEITGPDGKWDGTTASGRKAPEGSYFYHLTGLAAGEGQFERRGTFFLARDEVSITPNPASSVVKLLFDGPAEGPVSAEIFSLSGEMLLHHSFSYEELLIFNVSELPPGLYLLKVTGAEGMVCKKFVKE